ncbi:MAG: EF-hand domain-containing protein, partial [Planctomycetota bacterium]
MNKNAFTFIAPAFLALSLAGTVVAIAPPADQAPPAKDPGGQGGPGGPGQGPGGPGGEGRKRPDFKTLDKNGDGFITQDEVPADAWERMKKLDKNGDGKVSEEEMKQGMKG